MISLLKKAVFPLLLLIVFFTRPVFAVEKSLNVYFFWGDGCPHCSAEKPFLEEIKRTYPEVNLRSFEVWSNSKNRKYLANVGIRLGEQVSGVPFTVIGDEVFIGFNEYSSPGKIEERIKYCLQESCPDSVAQIVDSQDNFEKVETKPVQQKESRQLDTENINLPILGKLSMKNFSLPVLAVVMGGLDGFNPCAMWTLVFLIGLLLGMEDRKKRWILGSVFIIASAGVYFIFMAAWLNLIQFIGYIVWVRVLIGLIAIWGGIYYLKEYFTNKDGTCKVTKGKQKQAVFEKLKKITRESRLIVSLFGIVVLAFAVNLVELVCSAGLPVVFTQVLAMSDLPVWQYYLYMLLYIFVFMLDDLIIFIGAMWTMELTGLSTKYSRLSHFVGGILMTIVGLLLIFKPGTLMFG